MRNSKSAAEREENNLKGLNGLGLEYCSSQGQNLALTVLLMLSSIDSGRSVGKSALDGLGGLRRESRRNEHATTNTFSKTLV